MNSRGKLFVFAAPSGAGKTTIVRDVLKNYPEFIFSVSATTRKKRDCENEGIDYFFLNEDEFLSKVKNNDFIEWEKFYDYYYGTLKKFVIDKIDSNKNVVLEVDVKGAVNIKKQYPDSVLIFIAPPSKEILVQRLIDRNTETDEDLKKRIERSEMEMNFMGEFDFVVVNDELEKAKKEVKNIIEKEINKGVTK